MQHKNILNNYLTRIPDVALEDTIFIKELYNRTLLPFLERASGIISDSITNNKHIVLVTDYDADGITSAVVLTNGFKNILNYSNITTIVNKRKDGNGFNKSLVSRIIDLNNTNKIDLIITADHGSSDSEVFKYIRNELSIKIIVTDHHKIPNKEELLANTDAVVSNQLDADGITTHDTWKVGLCGCAIAFSLILNTRLHIYNNIDYNALFEIIPMVAVATITDIMMMDNEFNRCIIKIGLDIISYGNIMLWDIIKSELNIRHGLSFRDISYTIGPFINSANRTDKEELAFLLLSHTSNNSEEAIDGRIHDLVCDMQKWNTLRKTEQKRITEEVTTNISTEVTTRNTIVTIINSVYNINGSVASMVVNTFRKPAVVFSEINNDELGGSCRGYHNIDIIKIFKEIDTAAPGIIIKYGGHSKAGGIVIHKDKYDDFINMFEELYTADIPDDDCTIDNIEIPISEDNINYTLFNDYISYSPYGEGYKEPHFCLSGTLKFMSKIPAGFRFMINKTTFIYFTKSKEEINLISELGFGSNVAVLFTPQVYTLADGGIMFSTSVKEIRRI